MAEVFLGQILLFPFSFAPNGFALCRGQILPIAQNTALFALLGTTYGGNGQSTFALPNLQGGVPIGFGQGPGLIARFEGETGGSETVTVTTAQAPAHAHALSASSVVASIPCRNGAGNQQTPVGNVPATESTGVTATYSSAAPDAGMRPGNVALSGTVTAAAAGSSQPHNNRQPFVAMSYCIALVGIFPAQS